MSLEANKELVRRFLRAEDEVDFEAMRELVTPDMVHHRPGRDVPHAEFEEQLAGNVAVLKELRHDVDQIVAEDDLVSLVLTVSAVPTNVPEDWNASGAEGQRVSIQVMETFRVEDGRLADVWVLADRLGLLLQLGIPLEGVPPPFLQ